jgi:hypothetical protein
MQSIFDYFQLWHCLMSGYRGVVVVISLSKGKGQGGTGKAEPDAMEWDGVSKARAEFLDIKWDLCPASPSTTRPAEQSRAEPIKGNTIHSLHQTVSPYHFFFPT